MFGKVKNYFKKLKIKTMDKEEYISYLRNQGVRIGTGCDIAKTAVFGTEPWLIKIGNNTRITNNVRFFTHDGSVWTLRNLHMVDKDSVLYGSIILGDNCNIGWDTMIMPGVSIGDNVIIGCGSIITKSIPSNVVVAGVPGRIICSLEDYANRKSHLCVPTLQMNADEKRKFLEKNRPDLFEG